MNSVGSGIMPILVKDFGEEIAAQLAEELDFYRGKCYYDERKRKIVYYNSSDALHAYMEIQRNEIIGSVRSERGKTLGSLDEQVVFEWIKRNAESFRNKWKRTHIQVLSEEEILEYLVCEASTEDF